MVGRIKKRTFMLVDQSQTGFARYCPTFARPYYLIVDRIKRKLKESCDQWLETYLKNMEAQGHNRDKVLCDLYDEAKERRESWARAKQAIGHVFKGRFILPDKSKTGFARYLPLFDRIRAVVSDISESARIGEHKRLFYHWTLYERRLSGYAPSDSMEKEGRRQKILGELISALDHKKKSIKIDAMDALFGGAASGKLDIKSALPKLVQLLADNDARVRKHAFETLNNLVLNAEYLHPAITAAVTKLLQSAEFTVLAQQNTPAFTYAAEKCAAIMEEIKRAEVFDRIKSYADGHET